MGDRIDKHSGESGEISAVRLRVRLTHAKLFEKTLKKVLTKGIGCGKIGKSPREGNRRAEDAFGH